MNLEFKPSLMSPTDLPCLPVALILQTVQTRLDFINSAITGHPQCAGHPGIQSTDRAYLRINRDRAVVSATGKHQRGNR